MKGLLVFVVSIIGIVLSMIIAWKWRKHASHKFFLSLFVGLMMVLLFIITLVANYGALENSWINLISLLFYVILLIIPPNMYFYVVHYLSEKTMSQIIDKNIRHYFPALALCLINVTSFVLLNNNKEGSIYYTIAEDVMFYANSISLLFIFLLQNVFYIFLAIQKRRLHQSQLGDFFASEHDAAFQWIRDFIMGYAILIVALYLQIAQVFGGHNWSFALIVVSYVAYILYKGLQNPSFSELINIAEEEEKMPLPVVAIVQKVEDKASTEIKLIEKEEKQIIPEELQNQIWETIQQLMKEEKIYLENELTVYKLAKIATTNSKYLRLTIQKKHGQNFANYVNSFRVKHAQELLLDPEQELYNIEYIGEVSGFKSKSSFYSAFKKQAGLTPKAFRKKYG